VSGPSLVFENGGFEEETAAWRKNGGEVETVSSPRRSGAAAGRFSSESSATSWLYQAIAIDETQSYEFGGALMPEGTAYEAYLRISWYASGDGSGSLISSDDSTSRVSNGSSSFTWLTTGPINPPPGANSARLRVMLAPGGGGEAVVYLDDFALTTGPLVAPTSSPTAAPAATQTARAVEATRSASPASSREAASTPPPPGSTAQVAAARATATAKASQTAVVVAQAEAASPTPRRSSSGGSSPLSGSEDVNALRRPDEPAPLWPYFALPGVGLLILAGLLYGKRKEVI
jgi:hypothetical protein